MLGFVHLPWRILAGKAYKVCGLFQDAFWFNFAPEIIITCILIMDTDSHRPIIVICSFKTVHGNPYWFSVLCSSAFSYWKYEQLWFLKKDLFSTVSQHSLTQWKRKLTADWSWGQTCNDSQKWTCHSSSTAVICLCWYTSITHSCHIPQILICVVFMSGVIWDKSLQK
jgi:hypothetical protein